MRTCSRCTQSFISEASFLSREDLASFVIHPAKNANLEQRKYYLQICLDVEEIVHVMDLFPTPSEDSYYTKIHAEWAVETIFSDVYEQNHATLLNIGSSARYYRHSWDDKKSSSLDYSEWAQKVTRPRITT
jgi:hypothetical protein